MTAAHGLGVSAGGEPVGEHAVPTLGEHALRVELHALDGQGAVAYGHDHAGLRTCGDLELVRHSRRVDREGVVARRGERVGQPLEHPDSVVEDLAGLAVQEFGSTYDRSSVGLTDHLVAETDPENRQRARELTHHRRADPSIGGGARAG